MKHLDTITSASAIAQTTPRFWIGRSGEVLTGEEVAGHLDATLALLDREGWLRTRKWNFPGGEQNTVEVDDSTPIRGLLRNLLDLLRGPTTDAGVTLFEALYRVYSDCDGDWDTWSVSMRCLDAVLAAGSVAGVADHRAWSERQGRTSGEVRELLVTAAAVARQYGPTAASQKIAA